MATINKKPTKAHKDKKVIKAHQGMAHVPRQPTRRPTLSGRRAATDVLRPTRSVVDPSKSRPTKAINLSNATTRKNYTDNLVKDLVTKNPFNKPTRRPLTKAEKDQGIRYANPTGTLVSMPDPKPTRRPTATDTVGPVGEPMDERARRRRDNALKSEVDEMTRRFNRQRPNDVMEMSASVKELGRPRRPRRPTVQPIRQPSMNLGPLRNNFNPQQSTALTDRFNKLNQNNLNQNRLQMQRNKGGDIKKYAEGGLNKGMTKSRTKYGTVDNKKK